MPAIASIHDIRSAAIRNTISLWHYGTMDYGTMDLYDVTRFEVAMASSGQCQFGWTWLGPPVWPNQILEYPGVQVWLDNAGHGLGPALSATLVKSWGAGGGVLVLTGSRVLILN